MRLYEHIARPRAVAVLEHYRGGVLLARVVGHNIVTNAGLDFMHTQAYGPASPNGLNYMALSPDPVTETTASTTLSSEIAGGGLARAGGTFMHTPGTNVSTIQRTFTATLAQLVQKAALFDAPALGTMNHVLGFTPINLVAADILTVVFTITFG